MSTEQDSLVHIIHTVWSLALSALGALLLWIIDGFSKKIDRKADKDEVAQLRNDMAEWRKEQAAQHSENRARLDMIVGALGRRGR